MIKIDEKKVVEQTRQWVETFVIGEHLCPFAKIPFSQGRIRFRVSEARQWEKLLDALVHELMLLNEAPPEITETTLLVHPYVLEDFEDYLAFLDRADEVLEEIDLAGVIQIASFHPDYRFEDTEIDDPANYTNRSPYQMLHLIREASVEEAVASHPDPDGVPERNIEHLRAIGLEILKARLDAIKGTN
ncbi:MAG: DUF1415 domain-containing protein [Phaeodactylibacter sp.]|nr:DUF1415 domain-containing protein [Phaeodactylibacter sp.]